MGKGLLGTTLRYNYEVRDENDAFKGIPRQRIAQDVIRDAMKDKGKVALARIVFSNH